MRIERIAPGEAVLTMTVRADMLNGHAICHGGFIFTLADSAFAFACNSYNTTPWPRAARSSSCAASREGDVLTASARERAAARAYRLYDIDVTNQAGEHRSRCSAARAPASRVDRAAGARPRQRRNHARQDAATRRARADRAGEPRRAARAAAQAPAMVARACLRATSPHYRQAVRCRRACIPAT